MSKIRRHRLCSKKVGVGLVNFIWKNVRPNSASAGKHIEPFISFVVYFLCIQFKRLVML